MRIEDQREGEIGSFIAYDDRGEQAGELAYRMDGTDRMILDHTDVEEAFKGTGIGKKLILAAVEHARENGLKLRPLCTYAQLMFERNKEWADVQLDEN